jgi:hypothetical protein
LDVDDLLVSGEQLLRKQVTEAAASLDGPDAFRPASRPRPQLSRLLALRI